MTGVITAIYRKKGYGFIRDENDDDRFFHARDVRPDGAFEEMEEGDRVTFTPLSGCRGRQGAGNGLRADKVRRAE